MPKMVLSVERPSLLRQTVETLSFISTSEREAESPWQRILCQRRLAVDRTIEILHIHESGLSICSNDMLSRLY